MNYSKKKVLVIDTGGLGAVHAERISRDVAKCYYWNYVFKDFPVIEDFAKGYGLGNVEKVMRPFKYIDKVDLVYFTDVGWGDWADYLRKQGHLVFGASEAAEGLELDRFRTMQVLEKLGLPVIYSEHIIGLKKLQQYLDKNKEVYVKPDIFRGTRETTLVNTEKQKKALMKKYNARYGPMGNESCASFVCADKIGNAIVESGYDILFNGNHAIKPYSLGIESDGPYLLHYRNDLPLPLQKSIDTLSPLLRKLNYRGALSTEEIITDKKTSYIIDFTCRYANPLSAIFTETWKNYTDVIFKVADGKDVDIDVIAPYAGCLPVISSEASLDWLDIDINSDNEKNVKVAYGCKTKDGVFAVKGFATALKIIAWGETLKEVVDKLKELAHNIDDHDLDIETSPLDEIMNNINKMKGIGLEF